MNREMEKMTFTLEKTSRQFEATFDGVSRPITKWEQGLKGGEAFESGWHFDTEADRAWFEALTEDDKKQVRDAITHPHA